MERLTHKRVNGIRTGYWSPEKKETLVNALAEYENAGLTPEEIKMLNGKGADAPTNDGWIPVEERMPEDGQEVLCCDDTAVYLVEYEADWDAPFGDMDSIIAWRPLPEPYRPEKEEGRAK